ncbi:MAG: bifunctional 23S rRNA (guanine(2069)-N(7))-methyltransferase RlmK/23S rRNA (guanine(2445)-N(2))-methyltransferase RlmL [Cardiobacteriaceae bacterium]|nr:bifunctional 23S rRNA (guanine(2069)-N(7))-methyltransferase RlmK/23S rRNA (guanine(2445)-N(2))-methyltransferase RlmL [Cardiobacteriaceae bacterium]
MHQPIVLPCAKGSEQVLVAEAEALGLQNVRQGVAVVSGLGDMEVACRLCLWSRVASRVLWVLVEAAVENPDDMYALARTVAWDDHLDANSTFAVNFNGIGQGIRNTQFGALKIKDAIVDCLRDTLHRRPDVDAKNPDISIDAHLRKGRLTLALDLSGGALHQRGYRLAQGAAPLKEHLAATLLYRSGWPALAAQGYNLIDPLCGSGTILLEALLMAADIAPGLYRQHYGFTHWQSHKPSLWKRLLAEAEERKETGLSRLDLKIWGFDHDAHTLAAARENAARLRLSHCLHLERRDLSRFTAQPGYGERGLILTNPPYGERLGNLSELVVTYDTLGAAFKSFPHDWLMGIISSNADILKRLRLVRHKSYQAFNGGLETEIVLYHRNEQQESQQPATEATTVAPLNEQARMFANRLRKNYKAAQKAALAAHTDAYRVYDQDMPEYAIAVDLYGKYVHVQEYAPPKTVAPEKARKRLLDTLHVIPQILDIPPSNLVLKVRDRQRGKAQYEKQATREQYFTVQEGAARLLVNLHDYLDTGLFLDHRPLRRRLYEEAKNKRFLNLFCYTASASVQAALGGAAHTTSVDLSQTYLDWAHRNFDENQLDSRHRLIKADVMAWLNEGNSQYDLIFCDPPTFSNTKKEQRVFDIQRDQATLIDRCMTRLASGGTLYFSNNYRGFKLDPKISERYHCEDISAQTIDFDYARRPNIHKAWKIRAYD